MMDLSFKGLEKRINRVGKSFGNKLRKGADVLEWNINRKINNIDNSFLISLMNFLISQIKGSMQLETTQKVQM
jgi:hypothetical protein